ncbi:ABC transporter ATP-binding protein [Clostridium vincentii]|uniref:Teichoic acids export ATP-binding protein TagH n=1 Tax=Clostridium vincentii TaxID=52704 RepID=A0A2T0BGU8_9CLOT|nr:ABC transporter ATP-binding protein [Clostridium vincentii]PRR83057.1 Teichoic acids export ATP-binding protein TagH [Clostridium vincentii]
MSVMIKVKDLVKTYNIYEKPIDRLKENLFKSKKSYHREFVALNGLTFDVQKGDAIGILGKNGSGKSTLLKMITGVLTPTSGELTINGKIAAILELGAGFNMEYSGIENIYLNGTMMGYTREEMDAKIDAIVKFADIGDFINQPVKIYSSGMFARLAFAVAINVDPDILIVDEALAVGDTRFQIKCIEKMKNLKTNGTTILFVSHATEQIKRFCNKAIWLMDGRIKTQGESGEIADLYEDFMKYGERDNTTDVRLKDKAVEDEVPSNGEFRAPVNDDTLASIAKVELSKEKLRSFEDIEVEVTYDIYREEIDGFLLGVAIYTPGREYIFGPNTSLEKVKMPNTFGRHKVIYRIPKMPLLGGTYTIDVGIFTDESIINLDYKEAICEFKVANKYISEGKFYISHEWNVIE